MGSFHRIQRLNLPALPFDNCPGCPVYWLGGNVYLIDDSSVDYAAREAALQVRTLRSAARQVGFGGELDALLGVEEQLFLGDGLGPMLGVSYSSNDLWLELVAVTNQTAQLLVHTPETDAAYDLFQTASLATNGWAWVARGLPGQSTFTVSNVPCEGAFYILGHSLISARCSVHSKRSVGKSKSWRRSKSAAGCWERSSPHAHSCRG